MPSPVSLVFTQATVNRASSGSSIAQSVITTGVVVVVSAATLTC